MLSLLVPVAYAAEFSTSTAAQAVNDAISNTSATIYSVVPVILGLLAALIGLGWGVRKFKAHVSGKKF